MAHDDPTVSGTLAAAYAETGRFDAAVSMEEKAHALAVASGDTNLVNWHSQLLELYRDHKPYRESAYENSARNTNSKVPKG
jgi:hypothetical protein